MACGSAPDKRTVPHNRQPRPDRPGSAPRRRPKPELRTCPSAEPGASAAAGRGADRPGVPADDRGPAGTIRPRPGPCRARPTAVAHRRPRARLDHGRAAARTVPGPRGRGEPPRPPCAERVPNPGPAARRGRVARVG